MQHKNQTLSKIYIYIYIMNYALCQEEIKDKG